MKYDRPIWKVFNVVVVCAIIGFFVWLASHAPAGIGLVLCIPLFAWFASRALVHGGFGMFSWFSGSSIGGWQGTHYEFDNQKIRVEEHHDRLLFVAEDVLRATRIAPSPASWLAVHAEETTEIPGVKLPGFGMGQLERLVEMYPGTDAGRLLLWARREVVGPWEKKRERF
jgi:hypothetical protein